MLCWVMLCYGMTWYIMLCYDMLWYVMSTYSSGTIWHVECQNWAPGARSPILAFNMSSSGWQLWIRTLKFRNLNSQFGHLNFEISRCEFRVATLNSTSWMPELGSWLWILNCEFGIWSGEFATPSVISRMEFRSLNSQISWRQKYKYHKRRAKTEAMMRGSKRET